MSAPKKSSHAKMDASELNIGLALRNHGDLKAGGLFRLDTFSGRTLLMHRVPVPGIPAPKLWEVRDTTDVDVTHLMMWLQYNNFSKVSATRVVRSIDVEADRNAFSSAREMLDSLPGWDGVERLEKFWLDVCGVDTTEGGADEDEIFRRLRFLHATARCFFIGIVARVMDPGCKLDTMVVLEGQQGTQKSTLLRAIAFDDDEWFSDSMPGDLASKDAKQHLPGKLIIEMGEMNQMSRTKVDNIKQFLTTQTDKFRPSYGRHEVIHKRQGVFVGTTNSKDYLKDETGNRRFWPIACGRIDVELARQTMPQLYAEAMVAYNANENHFLPKDLEEIAEIEQRDRMCEDMWEGKIRAWVEAGRMAAVNSQLPHFKCTILDVAEKALSITTSQDLDQSVKIRAGFVLSKLGGRRERLMISGRRDWYHVFDVGHTGHMGHSKKPYNTTT